LGSFSFNDALNYRTRQQKEFFKRLFLRTDALEKCLLPTTYFLMGEKGTGKTAYAVYLENNSVGQSQALWTLGALQVDESKLKGHVDEAVRSSVEA
jgi:DNA-binding NtrC family response regulator